MICTPYPVLIFPSDLFSLFMFDATASPKVHRTDPGGNRWILRSSFFLFLFSSVDVINLFLFFMAVHFLFFVLSFDDRDDHPAKGGRCYSAT